MPYSLPTVQVRGHFLLVKFTDNSAKIIERIKRAMGEAIAETAEDVGNLAQSFAPVRTGELRDSKAVEFGFMVAWVGFTAKHAKAAEFGTSRAAANPFFLVACLQAANFLTTNLKRKKL